MEALSGGIVVMSIDQIVPPDWHSHRPPGLIGEIQDFILAQAPQPIHEVALAGAIALFAGIVGRQYNFSNEGLNQYILLVADTGMGKEAASAGMSKILAKLVKKRPAAKAIIGPADFSSGPGLVRSIAARRLNPCFVCVAGEFGIKLQQLANPRSAEHNQTLKRELLKFYSLSGNGRILEAYEYADKRNNTDVVHSPALTILGEGTGETIYDALDDNQVKHGLVPRFTIIEFGGICPTYNKSHQFVQVSDGLIERCDSLYAHVSELVQNDRVITVGINTEADSVFDAIREYTRTIRNSRPGDVVSGIWSRVDQKAQRLAALLAVSVDWRAPVITADMVKWSASLIVKDTKRLLAKYEAGEMGAQDETDSERQIYEIKKVVRKYVTKDNSEFKDEITAIMQSNYVISYSDISRSVSKLAAFRNDRRKAPAAIKATLSTLCDMAVLRRLGPVDKNKKFAGYSGEAYTIIDQQWVFGG
ncbi:hypothetical protein ACVDG8_034580 [Mesorhizobium sp. ORM8.1]